MKRGFLARPSPRAMLLGVAVFAFWRPLFAGATLAPVDQVWRSEPFASVAPTGLSIEAAPAGALAVHAAWAGGDVALADGVPVTHLAYSVLPPWFAPGVVAALTVVLAMFGARRLAGQRGVPELAASFAGLAYGASGLVFVWLGWHHATALALIPWVWSGLVDVAAIRRERGLAPLAVTVAALAWCGVVSLTVIGVVGGLLLAGLDRRTGSRWAAGRRLLAGVAVGVAGAAPHLMAAQSLDGWAAADIGAGSDTSAQWATSVTAVVGSLFGNEAVGLPWLTTGTLQDSVVFVGVVVLSVGIFGLAAGSVVSDRPGALGLLVLMAVGAGVTWVGGPFESVLDMVAGDGAAATDARVLIVLPLALAAADGLAAVLERSCDQLVAATRRVSVVAVCLVAVAAGALVRWVGLVDGTGLARQAAAEAWGSLLVAVTAAIVVRSWWTARVTPVAAAWALAMLVAFELLRFGMPIPTAAAREERLEPTPSHAVIGELLEASEGRDGVGLVAGSADVLSPVTIETFGIRDIRSPSRRSDAVLALFAAADPASTRLGVGGGPRAPYVSSDTANSGIWSAFGVDVWVGNPTEAPPGRRIRPGSSATFVDPVTRPVRGSFEIPEEGVRAVEFELTTTAAVEVEIVVRSGTDSRRNRTVVRPGGHGSVVVAVLGETLPPGPAEVDVRTFGEAGAARLGVQEDGSIEPGLVLGDGASELVAVDPILILHRPTPPARWAVDFVVEPDVAAAAALVHDRQRTASVVLDRVPGQDARPRSTALLEHRTSERRLDVAVEAGDYGILVLDVVDAPGWSVRVDGETVEPLIADAAFLAVPLGPGLHEVSAQYRRPHGHWSFVSLIVSVLLVARWVLNSRSRPWGAWAIVERRGAAQTRW